METIKISNLPIHTKGELLYKEVRLMLHSKSQGFSKNFKLENAVSIYIVGGVSKDLHKVVSLDTNRTELTNFLVDCLESIKNKPNQFVGGWYDKDSNIFEIEVSESSETLESALQLGRSRAQKAIYDVVNDKDVKC